jgi:hypothetical protein
VPLQAACPGLGHPQVGPSPPGEECATPELGRDPRNLGRALQTGPGQSHATLTSVSLG